MQRNLIIAGVVVAAVALAVVLYFNFGSPDSENFADGPELVCTNASCGHAWQMSVTDLADFSKDHYGEPIPCPKCKGTQTMAATRCPHCANLFAATGRSTVCPKCGKDQAGNVVAKPAGKTR